MSGRANHFQLRYGYSLSRRLKNTSNQHKCDLVARVLIFFTSSLRIQGYDQENKSIKDIALHLYKLGSLHVFELEVNCMIPPLLNIGCVGVGSSVLLPYKEFSKRWRSKQQISFRQLVSWETALCLVIEAETLLNTLRTTID